METFTAYTQEGINQFTFDPLVKNSTYTFLHFIPEKESPEKVRMIISLFEKDNTLVEEHDFALEIDGKKYNEHYIGLLQNGMTQKLLFTALDAENNNPLDKISIGVAIAKIKDGNVDDNNGGWFASGGPKAPDLIDKKLYV